MPEYKEITPKEYRCSMGACPAVYEDRTPREYRCVISASCPGVFESHKSGNFIFIGERLDPLPEDLTGKVSESEAAVSLDKQLVLASLGVNELVEAAQLFLVDYYGDKIILQDEIADYDDIDLTVKAHTLRALRIAISNIKGEN